MAKIDELRASVVAQHYSPSTKQTLTIFDDSPRVDEQIAWIAAHPDSILVYQRPTQCVPESK